MKRYELGTGDKGRLIYDNEGVDDYYFIDSPEELEQFIKHLNNEEKGWKENYICLMDKYHDQIIVTNEKDEKISNLKKEIMNVVDMKIKNTDHNPPKHCYFKVMRALKTLKENLRDVIEQY